MATIWIHRAIASDILVDFDSVNNAYDFAVNTAKNSGDEYYIKTSREIIPETLFSDEVFVASTPYLQFMITPLGTIPSANWNSRGFVKVSPDTAGTLQNELEPDGFEPYEAEMVWQKNTKTKEMLDAELDDYMKDWQNISLHALSIN
jgi:hypothetical protein